MKRPLLPLAIFVGSFLLFCRIASAQDAAPAPITTPIEGINVSLTPEGGSPDQTTTDKDGAYKFSYLAPGKYALELILPKAAATSKSTAKGKPTSSYDSVARTTTQERSPYGIDQITAEFLLKHLAGVSPASQATTTFHFEVKANQGNVTGHVTRVSEPKVVPPTKGKKKKAR